jgi:hypothetical protein
MEHQLHETLPEIVEEAALEAEDASDDVCEASSTIEMGNYLNGTVRAASTAKHSEEHKL